MNPLIQAIERNNPNQLKLLLDLGHDPNVKLSIQHKFYYRKNKTPLWFAFENKNMQCAQILLNSGANPNAIMENVVSSLDYDWCELILDYGANPNAIFHKSKSHPHYHHDFNFPETPLHYFAEKNKIELIELLILYGADIHLEIYREGKTPMISAINSKSVEAINCFIENGFILEKTDKKGNNLLYYAAINNHQEIAQLFISLGLNVNHKNNKGRTPLFYAIRHNATDVTKLLFLNNVDPEIKDKTGRTAVFCLAEKERERKRERERERDFFDNMEMVAILTENNVRTDIQDNSGLSLIGALVENEKPDTIEFLLQNGTHVKSDERINKLPFITYCLEKYTYNDNIALVLVKHNVQLNEPDFNGNTPLMVAIMKARWEDIAIALIKNGADINHCNKDGINALQLSVQYERVNVFRMLYNTTNYNYRLNENELQKITKASIAKFNSKALETIVDRHPEVITTVINISSSLCYLLKRKETGMAHLLIRLGSNVNIVDENDATPLFYAAHNNLPETASLLLKYGANPGYCNDMNNTPLIEAVKNNAVEVAKLLLDKGVDTSILNWEGMTAIEYAKQKNNTELIQIIEAVQYNRS